MKKSKILLPCVVCVAAMLIVVSCKKGDTGPAGTNGTNGTNGQNGTNGVDGNANVKYSPWIDTISYFLTTATTTDTIFGDLTVPDLTADILNNGEMKVYVNINTADPTDPVVVPLPYNDGLGGFIDVYFFLGGLELVSNIDLTDLPVRYILIEGSTPTGRRMTVDWKDYKAVQKYFGLKD